MKTRLTLLIIFSFITSCGHMDTTKVPFFPHWSKGDSYKFKVSKTNQEWNEDNLTKNDFSSYTVNFEVIDYVEKNYKIKWSHRTNWAGLNPPEHLLDALSKYHKTEVIYTVNEEGDFIGIDNWEEISSMMQEVFTTMADHYMRDTSVVDKEEIRKVIYPLMNIYQTQESIEQIAFKELQLFHFPFGDEYSTTKSIIYEKELPNIFGGKSVRGNTKMYFEEVDFEASHCVLIEEVNIDPEDSKSLLMTVFKQMKLNDKETEEQLKTAQFEIKDFNRFEYYYYPGIPVTIHTKREIIADFGIENGKKKAVEIFKIEWLGHDDYKQTLKLRE